jgi:hypothetical protein
LKAAFELARGDAAVQVIARPLVALLATDDASVMRKASDPLSCPESNSTL